MARIVHVPGSAATNSSMVANFPTPASSWIIPHTFDHHPQVTVIVGSTQVDADVLYAAGTVTIMFPTPEAGTAVLI